MPRSTFLTVLIGSTAIDAFLAGFVLLLARREAGGTKRRIGGARMLLAGAAMAASLAAKLPIWQRMGLDVFGLVHLVYLDLVVVIPALSAALLLAAPRGASARAPVRLKGLARPLCWMGLAPAALGVYATFIEPWRLQIETARVELPAARGGAADVRTGVLADIQTSQVTGHERRAVEELMALEPDVILVAGDLFHGWPEQFEREADAMRELLSKLAAPGGVYLVPGDVDWNADYVRRMIEGTRVQMLVNRIVRTRARDRELTIGGIEVRYDAPGARRLVRELETLPGDSDVRILLTHRPDALFNLRPLSRIDLVVAGHTHGGQVCVPFHGPLMTLSDVPDAVAAGGLHTMDGNRIYVSRGVGWERMQAPRIRFLCPPEVAVLTLCGQTRAAAR